MRKHVFTSLALVTGALFFATKANAQADSCCFNAGFERVWLTGPQVGLHHFLPWQGCIGSASTVQPWTCFAPYTTIGTFVADSGYNTATNLNAFNMITVNAIDPNSCANGCMTTLAPGGGTATVRLGNSSIGAEAERMQYSFYVDSCGAGFTYSYAVVLQDPSHPPSNQPRFDIQVTDINGNILGGPCGTYSVYAGSDPNFIVCGQVKYLCWVTVGIDLLPYVGQTVFISYATMDCTQSGHYGYAYIDAGCSPLQAQAVFCPNSNGPIVLIAPSGYQSYQWLDPLGNPIPAPSGINDTCIYTLPAQVGDIFIVGMVSAAGCTTNLTVTLVPFQITAATSVTNAICYGGLGNMTVTPNNGIPAYTVTYVNILTGDTTCQGTVMSGSVLCDTTAGTYVIIYHDSIGCEFRDTLTITQPPSPPDTLPQTMYFCNGDSTAYLNYNAGAGQFGPWQWMNYPSGSLLGPSSPTDPIITIPNPEMTQQFWVTWYDALGCKRRSFVNFSFMAPIPLLAPDTTTNVFTPNGDNVNDTYFPYISKIYDKDDIDYYAKEYEFKIYNRWGNLVYKTDDYLAPWDGKNNSAKVSPGVYFWIATYKNRCAPEEDPPIEKTGYVHVLR